MSHALFISYARRDNPSPAAQGPGPVSALVAAVQAAFQQRTGQSLSCFFDVQAIDEGRDWQRELGAGIRDTRLLLAVVSPHWLASPHCRWEWAQYLRREHATARGDDGIVQAWLLPPAELAQAADQSPGAAAWADLHRRQHSTVLPLPWVDGVPPAGAVAALAEHLARRLDAITLAELAPGNLQRLAAHFVGRHAELRAIHDVMRQGAAQGQVGHRTVIAAAHSPGGLGKTALARAYAHAHAGHFAAGGAWELPCEGISHLGRALARLASDARLQAWARRLGCTLTLSDAAQADDDQALDEMLAQLQELTQAHAQRLSQRRPAAAGLPTAVEPRLLLILDNVDQPDLLSAAMLARLPAGPWLELLVTTRLDPARDFAGMGWQVPVSIQPLPEADALALLQAHQPGGRFGSAEDEAASRQIVQALGGYTLLVELVAAYLGSEASTGYGPRHYLQRLAAEGLALTDGLADHAPAAQQILHREKRVGAVLAWSMDRLSPPARTALAFASRLMPDAIPLAWLAALTRQRHPDALAERPGYPSPWAQVWRELSGLSLMQAVQIDGAASGGLPAVVSMHRVVAAHAAGPLADECDLALEAFLEGLSSDFEAQVGQGDDDWIKSQHPWLRDQLSHLMLQRPTPVLAGSLHVVLKYEGAHGSLAQGIELGEIVLFWRERWLAQRADDEALLRDVSLSLEVLGDFLTQRGQEGDSERALSNHERDLEISEALSAAKPGSAHAVRDVSVSLNKLGDFLAQRGQEGDVERALAYYERSLQAREALWADSPNSALAARDVSVSLGRLGDLLAQRGQEGDVERALANFERSLEVRESLLAANRGSAQAARDVSASLQRLGVFLARRGQEGDAERALASCERCHDILEALLTENPGSAQAVGDVASSCELLAHQLIVSGGDVAAALGFTDRALALHWQNLQAQPGSYAMVRSAAIAAWNAAFQAKQLQLDERVQELLRAFVQVLEDWRSRGGSIEPALQVDLDRLKPGPDGA